MTRPAAWEPSRYGSGICHYFDRDAARPECGNGTRGSQRPASGGRTCRECVRKLAADLMRCAHIGQPSREGRHA